MFCKNCGEQIQNDDLFCPNCGQKTENAAGTQSATTSNFNFKELLDNFKSYFTDPVGFYSSTVQTEKFKFAGIYILFIAVVSTIINICGKYSLVNLRRNYIREIATNPTLTGSSTPNYERLTNSLNTVGTYFDTLVGNGKVITTTLLLLLAVTAILFIALEIYNAVILHNVIAHEDIAFISTTSFMPLLFSGIMAAISFNFSLKLGIIILILGVVLVFVRINTALNALTEIAPNKIYRLNIVLLIIAVIIVTFYVSNNIDGFKNFITRLPVYY